MTCDREKGSTEHMEGILRIEYSCTPAEQSEAQSLLLRHELGGGSKRLTMVMLLTILAGVLLLFWWSIRNAPQAIPSYMWVWWVVLMLVVFIIRRRQRKHQDSEATATVELSARGIRFPGKDSQATIPWEAISRRIESETLFLLQHRATSLAYVIPKRLLSPEWTDWLRDVEVGTELDAHQEMRPDVAAERLLPVENAQTSDVTVNFRLGFWNCLDWSAASWGSGRGAAIFAIVFMNGVWIITSFTPDPDAIFTDLEFFCYFGLPATLITAIFMVIMMAMHSRRRHRSVLVQQCVRLGETTLTLASSEGAAIVPWTRFTHYKETPWSFFLWRIAPGSLPRTEVWLMLPKSAFPSADATEKCRELLARHLKRSTWFFAS
jgi:YcxB-like protein